MTPKEDLDRSGLSDSTIEAMQIRSLTATELDKFASKSKHDQEGYLIPYFDLKGDRYPDFYRIRFLPPLVIKGDEIRYMQPNGSITRVYLPPLIDPEVFQDPGFPLRITEGEKKAAKACQEGIDTIALGGVNSWRSRKLKVDISSCKEHGEKLTVDLRGVDMDEVEEMVAPELLQINWEGRLVEICFDSDADSKSEVQRAAFELAMWLEEQGATVRQVMIPHGEEGERRGLDDFLIAEGAEAFYTLERRVPEHPRLRSWLRRLLDSRRLKRSDCVKAARAVLNALDSRGRRFVDPANGSYYYWDSQTHILHQFRWESAEIRQIRLSSFGSFIQDQFGVGATDTQLMGRIADLFASGGGLKTTTPRRVTYAGRRAFYFQLSDSALAKVTSQGISFVDNGTDGVLFLSGQVEPLHISPDLLTRDSEEEPRWLKTLESVNLQPFPGMTIEQTRLVVAALFYLSPWLRRWRGLMLPVELVVAEPNSGKTFLYNLRKAILTGKPSLDNPPPTQKDWYAQLTNAPGMWVCDNLGEPSRELKDHMSDELARLVTDPDPKVEMRKLYTTLESGTWPIDCTFAITSIRCPFWKPDIIQRSLGLNFKAIPKGQRDPMWYERQISGTGRALWVMDHLRMVRKFMELAEHKWNNNYLSSHRLVHFEQSLLLMGEAMGKGDEMKECIAPLFSAVQMTIVDSDPIMEALKQFVVEVSSSEKPPKEVSASDIVNWVVRDMDDRYSHLQVLKNPVRLGRYIGTHEYDISEVVGLVPFKRHNQTYYRVQPPKVSVSSNRNGKEVQ
jgi:hypothetical protein